MSEETTTSAPEATPPTPVELGDRLIQDMTFGLNIVTPTPRISDSKMFEPLPEQLAEQEWVRVYLAAIGCVYAKDIETLGCTGIAKLDRSDDATRIENGKRLVLGLAGGGVGLPCFVDNSRFCLIHNTIGGLERRQRQYHADFIPRIARELTADERKKVAVMIHATQKMRSPTELERFMAGDMPDETAKALGGVLDDDGRHDATTRDFEPTTGDGIDAMDHQEQFAVRETAPWVCTEHAETNWSCRYCLAQAVVEGPLTPMFLVGTGVGAMATFVPVSDVPAWLTAADQSKAEYAQVYVRAAAFTRKLARD